MSVIGCRADLGLLQDSCKAGNKNTDEYSSNISEEYFPYIYSVKYKPSEPARMPVKAASALCLELNPMRPKKSARFDTYRLNAAPRCTARSKRSGQQCRGPAVRGKRVCRMHGGVAGSGAPSGNRNGRYKHGGCTNEGLALLRHINMLGRLLKRLPR